MGEIVTFSIFLKDSFSKGMFQAAKASDNATNRIEKNFNDIEREAKQSAGSVSNSWGSAFSTIRNLATVVLGGALVKGSLDAAGAFQTTNVKFETFLGSAEKAKTMIADLDGYSLVTPFSPEQVNDAATTLLNFGITGNNIIPTIQRLGDVSAGNAEKFSSLSLVFGQVASAGKLQGQDLMQFINAGFNPLQELARKTGKSMGQLKDEMSKGLISAKDVALAIELATSEGGKFYNMNAKIAETYDGKVSTAQGNFTALLREFGFKIMPHVNKLLDLFNNNWKKILPYINKAGESIGWVVNNLDSIIAVVVPLIASIAAYNVVTKAMALWNARAAISQNLLNIAMNLNPVGLVVTAIALLVGGLILAWKKSETFRGVLLGLWEVLKKGWGVISMVAKAIWEFLPPVMMARASIYVLGNLFTWLGEVIENVFGADGVSGFVSNTFGGIFDFITNGIKSLITWLGGIADKLGLTKLVEKIKTTFQVGFEKGRKKDEAKTEEDTIASMERKDIDFSTLAGAMSADGKGGKNKDGLHGVAGDQKAARNMTVNINGGLVEKLEVHSTTISEGIQDVKEMVTKALIDAVRDFELSY